jgi:hypothetical protein
MKSATDQGMRKQVPVYDCSGRVFPAGHAQPAADADAATAPGKEDADRSEAPLSSPAARPLLGGSPCASGAASPGPHAPQPVGWLREGGEGGGGIRHTVGCRIVL